MSIRIGTIHYIPVECKRSTCFYSRSQYQSDYILDANSSSGKTWIIHAIPIPLFPFFPVIIFQTIFFDSHNLIRTEQIPLLIQIFFCHLPEQVRIAYGGKYIMSFHAVIPIIRTELKKFRQVFMPYIQIYSYSPLTHS